MSVYTTSASMVGSYGLQLTGTISGETTSTSALFSLYVTNVCAISTITSVAISRYSYDINEGTTNTISSLGWS